MANENTTEVRILKERGRHVLFDSFLFGLMGFSTKYQFLLILQIQKKMTTISWLWWLSFLSQDSTQTHTHRHTERRSFLPSCRVLYKYAICNLVSFHWFDHIDAKRQTFLFSNIRMHEQKVRIKLATTEFEGKKMFIQFRNIRMAFFAVIRSFHLCS